MASVGYPLQVIVYKVLDSTGNGSDTVIAQAIEAAANAGAQVVSMSLGGTGYSPRDAPECDRLRLAAQHAGGIGSR